LKSRPKGNRKRKEGGLDSHAEKGNCKRKGSGGVGKGKYPNGRKFKQKNGPDRSGFRLVVRKENNGGRAYHCKGTESRVNQGGGVESVGWGGQGG